MRSRPCLSEDIRLRVYRDRRGGTPKRMKKRRRVDDVEEGREPPASARTSSGMKVLELDRAPTLEIGETEMYDDAPIKTAMEVEPERAGVIGEETMRKAPAVGPDGRTSYERWEERVREEERTEAARWKALEVKGASVRRKFEDFRSRCDNCKTTTACPKCKGKGKVYFFFTCKVCSGSGRCLQCLAINERPCPVCGEDLPLHDSRCDNCGREFLCPRCHRHLPFESTHCPTCDVDFTCANCGRPVAVTHQKTCPHCGGKSEFGPAGGEA